MYMYTQLTGLYYTHLSDCSIYFIHCALMIIGQCTHYYAPIGPSCVYISCSCASFHWFKLNYDYEITLVINSKNIGCIRVARNRSRP